MSDSNSSDFTQRKSDDSQRDGRGLDTALVIRAENAWIGVGMEYDALIARHGPMHEGWTLKSQRLLSVDDRHYDRLDIMLNHGEELSYFFDITDVYGQGVPTSDEIKAMLDDDDVELDGRSTTGGSAMTDLDPHAMTPHAIADRQDESQCVATAVIIRAETVWSSVCEEYDYLSLRHGPTWKDWTVRIQACSSRHGRHYDLIEVIPNHGEPQTYCFDVTNGYEDGFHEVSVKQGLMETRRHPVRYFQVKLDEAATARVLRYPEGEAMWAEVVALACQNFERKKARSVLADALVTTRALLRE